MTATTDALLESLKGPPVLDPGDLAAAFVAAANEGRLSDLRAAMDTKPGPRIPPRYESEVRTWLSRVTLEDDARYARVQAYAAMHLDPNNTDALAALDAACESLGETVRAHTWSAVVHSYPDVKAVRDAVSAAGLPLPDRDLQKNAGRRAAARKRRHRTDEPLLVDADSATAQAAVPARKPTRAKTAKAKATGYAALVPALEPDAVCADRLAVLHLVARTDWVAPPEATDPLSLAQAGLREGTTAGLPSDATGTATFVALSLGEAPDGRGPLYGRLLRRMKNHPAVVAWAVRAQLDEGDIAGARAVRTRLEAPAMVWADELTEIDRLLGIATGDVDAGWAAWEAGSLPSGLRPGLARALQGADRGHDADEVLGLPDVSADEIDDPDLLCVRFDLLFVDGDVDGALAQARRAVLLRATSGTVPRLWLGLYANGELDELAGRMEDDADAVGMSVADLIAAGRSLQEKRVDAILRPVRADVEATRSAYQELAKGRTIRETDAFEAAVATARARSDELREALSLIAPPRPARYPAAAEDLVSFLAAAGGLRTRPDGEFVVTEIVGTGEGAEPDAVAPFFAPARELISRADLLAPLLARAQADIETAAEQGRREDVPRRRLEERVARYARSASAALTTLLSALDVFAPRPEIDLAESDATETDAEYDLPDTDSGEGDAGDPGLEVPGGSVEVDFVDEVDAESGGEVEVEAESITPAETGEAGTAGTEETDETATGRWFRRRR
ncbi:MAG: hypothetical protein IT198_04415 [Acidimicrobiia bacterium]|nr:hypothetical protein [Acidimicrobiia bacterium]